VLFRPYAPVSTSEATAHLRVDSQRHQPSGGLQL
jgi:hypothetical protein